MKGVGAIRSVEESSGLQGGSSPIHLIDDEIAEVKARLQQLLREKSRATSTALPARVTPEVSLYPWQQRALDSWRAGGRRGVVQAVTGAGKTRVGIAAIAEALGQGRRAIVVVPTLLLVRQWVETCAELLPDVPVSVKLGDHKPWRIQITTIQSAMKRAAIPSAERALVVVDEAHRAGAEGFGMALRPEYDWRLGLTATLERGDDGDDTLGRYFGGIVHDLGYGEALADSLISPFRFAQVSVPLLPHEQERYVELTAGLRDARDRLLRRHDLPSEPISLFLKVVSDHAADTASPASGLARYYMKLFSDRRRLLAETPVKMVALAALSSAVMRANGTIIFTQTQEASRQAAKVLQEAGCSSAYIHGELDKDSREERIDLFRDGAITTLTAPRVLDEGVDLPDADLGIVTAANRSRRQMIQRLGRVLRRRDGKLARFVVMFAAGTVEDPSAAGYIPDFYEACLPFAESERTFDLGQEGQAQELLRFLGVEEPEIGEALKKAVHFKDVEEAPIDVDDKRDRLGAAADLPRGDAPREHIDLSDAPAVLGDLPMQQDPVKLYLKEIGRRPLLKADEEVALSKQIEAGLYARHLLVIRDPRYPAGELEALARRGIEARERLIQSNLRLVVSLAKRYTGRGLLFLDLIQEGNVGMIHASEMFDFALGYKFSTYATWWIKQALSRALADQGATIRIPVHAYEKRQEIIRLARSLGMSLAELVREFPDGLPELDVSAGLLVTLAQISRPLISTQAVDEAFSDTMPLEPLDGWPVSPSVEDSVVVPMSLEQEVSTLLSSLEIVDARTAFILRCRHGFETGEPETLDAIGKRLGLSRERIRQLERQGMELLRGMDSRRVAQLSEELLRSVAPWKRRRPPEVKGKDREKAHTVGAPQRVKRAESFVRRAGIAIASSKTEAPYRVTDWSAPRRAAEHTPSAEPAIPRRALFEDEQRQAWDAVHSP